MIEGVGQGTLGWSCHEGTLVFDQTRYVDGMLYTDPVFEFPTQVTAFGAGSRGGLYVVNDLPGGLRRLSFARA